LLWRLQVRWRCQELLRPHRPKPDDWPPLHMGAIPSTGPTLGTRGPTPIRPIITVTPRIAEELVSPFTLDLHITAIGTADLDISVTGMTAGIVIGKAIVVANNRTCGVTVILSGQRIEPGSSGRKTRSAHPAPRRGPSSSGTKRVTDDRAQKSAKAIT